MSVPRWSEMLPEFEGVKSFLYADETGLPTCGVGHACETAEEAASVFGDERAAEDWTAIKNSVPGQQSHLYEPLTVCRLTDEQINAVKEADIADTEKKLLKACPDSGAWPDGVRDAALDIEYNVIGGILTFPHMLAAIREQDWATAAAESNRPQLQASRNKWTADSIRSAAA